MELVVHPPLTARFVALAAKALAFWMRKWMVPWVSFIMVSPSTHLLGILILSHKFDDQGEGAVSPKVALLSKTDDGATT